MKIYLKIPNFKNLKIQNKKKMKETISKMLYLCELFRDAFKNSRERKCKSLNEQVKKLKMRNYQQQKK